MEEVEEVEEVEEMEEVEERQSIAWGRREQGNC